MLNHYFSQRVHFVDFLSIICNKSWKSWNGIAKYKASKVRKFFYFIRIYNLHIKPVEGRISFLLEVAFLPNPDNIKISWTVNSSIIKCHSGLLLEFIMAILLAYLFLITSSLLFGYNIAILQIYIFNRKRISV